MKNLYIALTAVLAMSAVVPANAQSQSRQQCWFQTDSSRLTGFYDVCPDAKVVEQAAPRRQLTIVTHIDSPRDSGGEGNGGGGGSGR